MKKITCYFTIIALLLTTFSIKISANELKISLKDLDTNELISDAKVELYVPEFNLKKEIKSDQNGVLNLNESDYMLIKEKSMVIEVESDLYQGESLGTNIYDEAIHVKQHRSRDASGWNTISSTYSGIKTIPIYRVPGYGGLNVEMQISSSQAFSIGSYSFTSGTAIGNVITVQSNINECWIYATSDVGSYSVKQMNTAGAVRYITTYNRPYSIDLSYTETTAGMDTASKVGVLSKNQNQYVILTYGSGVSFSASTKSGYFTVTLGAANGTQTKYTQTSVGKNYTYTIYKNKVKKSL